MTPEERKILEDMKAYIAFELAQDTKSPSDIGFRRVLVTLSHDIGGIVRKERCFLPRTSGYSDMTGGQ